MTRIHNSLYVNTLKRGKKEVRISFAACQFVFWDRLADGHSALIFNGLAGDGRLASLWTCLTNNSRYKSNKLRFLTAAKKP
jgi:hypothetical protein